jgi:hypothetical protein
MKAAAFLHELVSLVREAALAGARQGASEALAAAMAVRLGVRVATKPAGETPANVTTVTIGETLRALFEQLRELDKTDPAHVDAVVGAIVNHVRSWRPESVVSLGQLPAPGEPIRDPRSKP